MSIETSTNKEFGNKKLKALQIPIVGLKEDPSKNIMEGETITMVTGRRIDCVEKHACRREKYTTIFSMLV